MWLSLVAFPLKLSTVPSPQSTLMAVTGPSGSDAVIESVTLWPEVGFVGEALKLTTGGRLDIVTCDVVVEVDPLLSVTVSVTVKVPAVL